MNSIHPAIRGKIGSDLTELIEEVRLTGEMWAKSKAKTERLDEYRKIRFAELREHYRKAMEDSGQKVTEARLDDLARRHDDYKAVVQDRFESALEEAENHALHFAKRNALDALIETMRQERTEMRFTQNA